MWPADNMLGMGGEFVGIGPLMGVGFGPPGVTTDQTAVVLSPLHQRWWEESAAASQYCYFARQQGGDVNTCASAIVPLSTAC